LKSTLLTYKALNVKKCKCWYLSIIDTNIYLRSRPKLYRNRN